MNQMNLWQGKPTVVIKLSRNITPRIVPLDNRKGLYRCR